MRKVELRLKLELSAGVAFAGNVRLENKKGRKIDDQDYDPQGVIGVRLVSVF